MNDDHYQHFFFHSRDTVGPNTLTADAPIYAINFRSSHARFFVRYTRRILYLRSRCTLRGMTQDPPINKPRQSEEAKTNKENKLNDRSFDLADMGARMQMIIAFIHNEPTNYRNANIQTRIVFD